jgi:hypothetical protein
MMNDGAWELRRQRCALGFLARLFWSRSRKQCRQLSVDSLKVGVKQVVEQAALLRTDLLAALGKSMPFEDCDLVGQLLDDGVIAVALSAHGVDLRHQLRSECTQLVGGHLVEIGQGSHAVDFIKADRLRQQAQTLITAFLKYRDCTANANTLPRKPKYQGLKLLAIKFQLATLSNAWPLELPLVQPACRQPNTNPIMHQHFHAIGPTIGKQISAVRLRRTEHRNYSGQCGLGTGAHIHGLGGEPDGVDTDH